MFKGLSRVIFTSVSSTSGPGVCLKSEAMNLAVITELPLVVINVQRGGPSTGLPTKSEQPDLLPVSYTHLDVYKRQVLSEMKQKQMQHEMERRAIQTKNTLENILKSATIIQYTIKGRFMSR